MERFEGFTAVVTGGASGIGRSLCHAWADEGMNVVVADLDVEHARSVADEVTERGVSALGVQCDVSDSASVEALAAAAVESFGAVHLLCNNAGVAQTGRILDTPQQDWDWLFSVNVWGVLNCIRTFVPLMKEQPGRAHVLNTSSLSGIFAVSGIGAYTASKYAVVAISETLRMEVERYGIGVSVLCPGPTRSRIAKTARHAGRSAAPNLEAPRDDLAYLGFLEPEEVAARAVAGVKANRLYVFSHEGGQLAAEERFREMLDGFAEMAEA